MNPPAVKITQLIDDKEIVEISRADNGLYGLFSAVS
jgi:hypothetical protein